MWDTALNSANLFHSEGNCLLNREYFRYLHKTDTGVLTTLSSKSDFISQAAVLLELNYLAMLFISQLTHPASTVCRVCLAENNNTAK